jgi:hypothetical protein
MLAGTGSSGFDADGKAGKFGFVPICYLKIAGRK